MRISAAVAREGQEKFSIEHVELDQPRADEILVRIVGVGLCHTDIFAAKTGAIGGLPAVLGHEGSGIVEEVGAAVSKVKRGDRVTISFRSCGNCVRCQSGEPAYCLSMPMLNFAGRRPDGSKAIRRGDEPLSSNFFGQSSFATHCLTYERNVVVVPADVPLELMGPLGCGVQTGAGSVMRSLACKAGSSLLILGGGAVGLSAVLGAVVQGCGRIIVLEPHQRRRELAIELGATHAIDPAEAPDLAAAVRAIVPSGVDYAFDTTGIPHLQQATIHCLTPHGTFGLVGISPPGTPVPGDTRTVLTFGLTIKGIIEGDSDPDLFIPEMIELYKKGRFPFDRLITTYPFEEINRAIAEHHAGLCIKAVLLPPSAGQATG